ncbi:MAG: radical SAM protein, partial [Pseudomonadota bacterium]
MNEHSLVRACGALQKKFSDPLLTAKGETRASVRLTKLDTLWFNTGTLCNIQCANCYILSSPTNDALVYLTTAEVETYLDEIEAEKLPTREIGFTGGEPFMNPDFIPMLELALARGFEVLVLTNAMRPMMRPSIRQGLERLIVRYQSQLTLRISLDHYTSAHHDAERGKGSFEITLQGMRWLRDQGAQMAVAGRSIWGETETQA